MKGRIRPDHIPVNKYDLRVVGLPPLTLVECDGIEDALETVNLPDRTVATGGQRGTIEWSMMVPMHHTVEVAALEGWYKEGQDPVSPSYKKAGTLVHNSLTGITVRAFQISGMFVAGRVLPDLEMENEGEMATIEYKMKADDIKPL